MAKHQMERLHAACDECRTRKLKCSGHTLQCSRCLRESIRCVYSPQKQMGRPRKRRRHEASLAEKQTRNVLSEPILVNNSPPNFGDYGNITSQLDVFSDLQDFQGHDGGPDPHVSVLHDEYTLANVYGHERIPHDYTVDPTIDYSLWNAQPNGPENESIALAPAHQPEAPCTCLSVMYLAISDLQTMSSFAFPVVMVPLRQAMATATTLLQCEKCSMEPFTAIQNVQSLNAILSALAERFHKVLQEVDAEAERLEQADVKKLFRVSDANPGTQHLHTGNANCPMGFEIELEGKDWKRLVKKSVRTEVLGGGTNPTPLISLLSLMEQRQRQWHTNHANMEHLDRRIKMFGAQNVCSSGDDATCLRMVAQVRSMIQNMVWE